MNMSRTSSNQGSAQSSRDEVNASVADGEHINIDFQITLDSLLNQFCLLIFEPRCDAREGYQSIESIIWNYE